MRRTISVVLVALFLFAGAIAQPLSPNQGATSRASLDERLGADDGAAFAILFGANLRGNLDLCD